jgi:uncharacterized membrane protein YhaH (DUF805 family)
MLGFIFGLNARLGRLHYFLASIATGFVMAVLCFLLVLALPSNIPRGTHLTPELMYQIMKWPIIGLGMLAFLISLTLQSMRIRDIGWDPVCVIPTWMAIWAIDFAVARKFPGLSLGPEHYGTVVGGLVNLVMTLALLFWPSGDYDGSTPDFGSSRLSPDPSPRGRSAAPAVTDRIARASGEFGRRSF